MLCHYTMVLSCMYKNITHVLDLESVRFQTCKPYNFMYCITLDMFYIQLFVLLVDSWNVNKISKYQIPKSIAILFR